MREMFAVVLALSTMAVVFVSANQAAGTPQTAQTCTLKISGMVCSACAATVEKTGKKIDGVISIKASQPRGTAEITYDPAKTTPDAIAKAITKRTPFKAEEQKPKDR
jgi:periplasmic mercuric ion binding protein